MMHEDLLAAVDPRFAYGKIGDALRAVIELHKPVKDPFYKDMVCHCGVVGDTHYPCPTIEAIAEVLK